MIQHRLTSGPVQLVNNAASRSAAIWRGAVNVARRVANHARVGIFPIGAAGETVQHRLAARVPPEHHTRAVGAAFERGAIEAAGRIAHQTGTWRSSSRRSREIVQHGFGCRRLRSEHRRDREYARKRSAVMPPAAPLKALPYFPFENQAASDEDFSERSGAGPSIVREAVGLVKENLPVRENGCAEKPGFIRPGTQMPFSGTRATVRLRLDRGPCWARSKGLRNGELKFMPS